ncbi:MAG: pre-peptidase C-terminal domain-containing protein [Pseudomonadota bacterium]
MVTEGITGDTKTTGVIDVGATITGELASLGARDWYKVHLTAGESYFFAQAGSTTRQGTMRDPLLYLYDSNGDLVTQNDDSGGTINSRITYTATRSGDYFLGAGSYKDSQTGTFQLAAGSYQNEFSTLTPGKLNAGESISGNLEVLADIDWIRVDLKAGTKYAIAVEGMDTQQGTLTDPYLYVYDNAGKNLDHADDGGVRRNSLLNFTPESSGTYFFAVGDYNDASSGTYRLSLSEAPDKASQSQGSGQGQDSEKSLSLGSTTSGEIATVGGQDRYSLDLKAGQTYCFDLQGQASGEGSLYDPYLYLYDNSGSMVGRDDDSGQGLNSRLVFTPVVSGKYYLGAAAFDNGQAGTYSLSAYSVPQDDKTQDSWSASPLSAFGARQGTLADPGSHNWVALSLEAASSYLVTLEGESGEGGLATPSLGLYNSNGTQVGWGQGNASQGGAATINFTPGEGGIYYVDAGAYGQNDSGRYLLSIVGRQLAQFFEQPAYGDWSVRNPLLPEGSVDPSLLPQATTRAQGAQAALADPTSSSSAALTGNSSVNTNTHLAAAS